MNQKPTAGAREAGDYERNMLEIDVRELRREYLAKRRALNKAMRKLRELTHSKPPQQPESEGK